MLTSMTGVLEQLVGKTCWSVIGGKGVGSQVNICFGGKIARKIALKNPSLTSDEREFESEYSVFVEEAPWRLRRGSSVICTSVSPPVQRASPLRSICNKKVVKVHLDLFSFDLSISFDDGLFLEIFCIWKDSDDQIADNYTVYSPSGHFSINGNSGCDFESKR